MKVTQAQIARRVGMDVSSVNKILNRRPGPVFRSETVKKVFRVARELGYDFDRLKHAHRRRHSRRELNVGVELTVYRSNGDAHDQGMATIRDLSCTGARISDVQLTQGTIPVGPVPVRLRPMAKPLEGIELSGRIVRFLSERNASYAIEFGKLPSEALRRLQRTLK